MAEGLSTADGTPLSDVPAVAADDTDFAAMMAAQASAVGAPAHDVPAPPRKDVDAPFGRTKDGTPRKPPGRRPAAKNAAKPRVQAATALDKGAPPKDYTPGLRQLFGTAWSLASLVDQADAGAVLLATPALVDGWNGVAQRNPRVGKVLDYLTGGAELGGAAIATVMLGLQIAANHRVVKAEEMSQFGVKSREELAAINAQALEELAEAQAA